MSQRRRPGRSGRTNPPKKPAVASATTDAPKDAAEPAAPRAGRRGAAPARSNAAPEKKGPPIGLILGGLGLVAAIVVAVMFMSGGNDKGNGTGSGDGGSTRVAEQDGETGANGSETETSGGGGDTGSTGAGGAEREDEEDDEPSGVAKTAKLRAEFKRKSLLAETKDQKIALAKWCKKNGLEVEAREIAEPLLAKYPDNGDVNRILGMKRFDGEHPDYFGKWLTSDAYDAAMEKEKVYHAKLDADPQFRKMHETARSLSTGYLKDFNVFSIMEWPYVIMIEDFGTANRNEYYGSVNQSRVRAIYKYMKEHYPKLFKEEPEFPFKVIVLKDQASFNKFNEQLAGGARDPSVRAYFNTVTKFVYTYEKDERRSKAAREFSLGVLFHECTHQLLDFLRPKNHIFESMWFEEALAEYHGGVRVVGRDDDDLLTYKLGQVNNIRLKAIKRAFKKKHYFPLRVMFGCRSYEDADRSFSKMFGQRSVGRGKSLLYCQGWSFIYFCLEGPNKKYRESMLDYIRRDIGEGDGDYRNMAKAFGIAKKEQWDPIEREWKAFVTKLEDPEK